MPSDIKECSLYAFTLRGQKIKTTPKDITARAAAEAAQTTANGKQDALSSAQMDAVNSGITADDLAVNDASVLCKATPIVPTLTNGSHQSTVGGCYYYKVGFRVYVHIGVQGLTANTNTTIWTMPVGYRPYSYLGFGGTGATVNAIGRARVAPDGRILVSSASPSACIDFSYDAFA